jgi:hypothetical protein
MAHSKREIFLHLDCRGSSRQRNLFCCSLLFIFLPPTSATLLSYLDNILTTMGWHAFKSLHCPRMPPDVYARVKNITTLALQTVFTHVTAPFEVPGEFDYGDIDFLVSAPFGDTAELTLTTYPFQSVIESIKHALRTTHGRQGFFTPDCMYFAIPLPSNIPTICIVDDDSEGEQEVWVQVDVKICLKPEMFSWMTFELNFASQSSILGSMIKPLGLTLDPEGLHVRVEEIEEMEATDWAGSTVFVTKDSWLACRVLGLGRRVVDGGFRSSEEREWPTS